MGSCSTGRAGYAVDRTQQQQAQLADIEKAQQAGGAPNRGVNPASETQAQAGGSEKAEKPKQGRVDGQMRTKPVLPGRGLRRL